MIFVGDVHGKFRTFSALRKANRASTIVQVGDFGIGFGIAGEPIPMPDCWFIRGNHDNPTKCRNRSDYLGDYGYHNQLGIFFVSGALSIDRDKRLIGKDWWPDEELSYAQCSDCIAQYEKIKPAVVVSHDCPGFLVQEICSFPTNSRTQVCLSQLYEIHQPRLWVFGHHHMSLKKKVGNTLFVCLDELETFKTSDPV